MTGLWDSPSVPDPAAGPRGRGNPNADMSEPYYWRSIPAWAGEPRINPRLGRWRGVYPRVGGGTLRYLSVPTFSQGLSPRGRGNPTNSEGSDDWTGSIPAWAGEPGKARPFSPMGWVYPRVGGGTATWKHGSRPPNGLSPRGRGNLRRFVFSLARERSIPAWAGEPPLLETPLHRISVYPRVGGGTLVKAGIMMLTPGLSPRGRGNLCLPSARGIVCGSIPAWAGEPVPSAPSRHSMWVYPRVGGGTVGRSHRSPPVRVYPRVGGGTSSSKSATDRYHGLSPRGRGNPQAPCPRTSTFRSIPAWAGEPDCPISRTTYSNKSVYPRVGGGTEAS